MEAIMDAHQVHSIQGGPGGQSIRAFFTLINAAIEYLADECFS
jgi:hypothetical protein